MFYVAMALVGLISLLLIWENSLIGWIGEKIFRLPKGAFYSKYEGHARLLGVFKWPLLLALIGLAIPSPLSYDFILAFIIGFLVGWRDFRRPKPKELAKPSKEIDLTVA